MCSSDVVCIASFQSERVSIYRLFQIVTREDCCDLQPADRFRAMVIASSDTCVNLNIILLYLCCIIGPKWCKQCTSHITYSNFHTVGFVFVTEPALQVLFIFIITCNSVNSRTRSLKITNHVLGLEIKQMTVCYHWEHSYE